jgi:hypothetical protein
VEWKHLPQDRDERWALVNTVINLRISWKQDWILVQEAEFLRLILNISGLFVSQNWEVCHIVWSELQFPQLKLSLQRCYFVRYFSDNLIRSQQVYVQFIHVPSDGSAKRKDTGQSWSQSSGKGPLHSQK